MLGRVLLLPSFPVENHQSAFTPTEKTGISRFFPKSFFCGEEKGERLIFNGKMKDFSH